MEYLFGFILIYALVTLIARRVDNWLHFKYGKGLFPSGYWKW